MKDYLVKNWVYIVLTAVFYAGCGFFLADNGTAETWLYRVGLLACTLVPIFFVSAYTYLGFKGVVKWWVSKVRTAFVQAVLSISIITGPLAYVFWFNHGMLTASWLAWLEVSGPIVCALAWGRFCGYWLAGHVRRREEE